MFKARKQFTVVLRLLVLLDGLELLVLLEDGYEISFQRYLEDDINKQYIFYSDIFST